MTDLAIDCRGICKAYGDFALQDIGLTLEAGQIMGFIGPNGAGKSTTLRILMGLVQQDSGSVRLLGQDMPEARIKEQIGYVSEDMRLYPDATLGWHMKFMASVYPSWDQSHADMLLKRFELTARQCPRTMSHGQRVKASLLLTLARSPRLLLLDEPTTGLDPVARQEILSAMMDILKNDDHAILFSSHNTQDVEQLSDCITFIDKGRITQCSDKESFLDQWRRIRIKVPEGSKPPHIEGIQHMQSSGRLAVLTLNRFTPDIPGQIEAEGAVIQAIEHMTLEEIFIADVAANRGRTL